MPSEPSLIASSSNHRSSFWQRLAVSGKHKKIVTRSFTGRFRNLRRYLAGSLMAIFFFIPWLNWQEHQAVWWDLDSKQFFIFGATFWPEDLVVLSGILIVAAFGLFVANVVVGRAWCGYTCPQSVWTWWYMWVEKITEGDRNQRIKLDAEAMSWQKLFKRSAKHSLWWLIAFATGLTFVGYFTPIRSIVSDVWTGNWFNQTNFWVMSFAGMTYLNAGWLRENVCMHMCPYSRFQSVMFDKDTLVVTYNSERGDARGGRKKGEDPRALGLGDCVDCFQCVQVCPTGIDIRNGLQMDCIGCGACIDVCDSVMEKMDYAPGLIAYASERQLMGEPAPRFRPRLFAYAAVLVVCIGFMFFYAFNRDAVSLSVTKDRALYRIESNGNVSNVYRLKAINKTQQKQGYTVLINSSENIRLKRRLSFELAAGEVREIPIAATASATDVAAGSHAILFELEDAQTHERVQTHNAQFIMPSL